MNCMRFANSHIFRRRCRRLGSLVDSLASSSSASSLARLREAMLDVTRAGQGEVTLPGWMLSVDGAKGDGNEKETNFRGFSLSIQEMTGKFWRVPWRVKRSREYRIGNVRGWNSGWRAQNFVQ